MTNQLELVSHVLCPYVQRAAIALSEKNVPFMRTDIDLANKPDWFKALSPLGKVPLLRVEGEVLFESAVIVEYLEDTQAPALHPRNALARARHRAWIEFGSTVLNDIWGFYTAADDAQLQARRELLRAKLASICSKNAASPCATRCRVSASRRWPATPSTCRSCRSSKHATRRNRSPCSPTSFDASCCCSRCCWGCR